MEERVPNNTEIEITPNWIRPDMRNEAGEIVRVIRDFLGQEPSSETVQEITRMLQSAPEVELSDEVWATVENTDSFHHVRSGHLEDAENLTAEYNAVLPVENRRDFNKLLDGFKNGSPMELPAIIRDRQGKMHLISGNTRLMIARALRLQPKVIIGDMK
jgi:hypothetical protein